MQTEIERTRKQIIDAYCKIRTIDNTIPDDVLDFMKHSALEKLSSPPVEQTVDAGQLEKIIGDAFDAGNAYQYTISPTKAEYIKQAIELYNNFKS